MSRCVNEGDWIRRELEIAIKTRKRIIPINPDNTFDGMPDDAPKYIRSVSEDTLLSEVNFGQNLNVTIDKMVRNRIKPYFCS